MTGNGIDTRIGTDLAVQADTPIDCHADPVDGARRLAAAFDAGRRLVIVAPGRDDHARHVAVEFLHPVVTGSVALPAMVTSSTPPAERATDVVLHIGETDGSGTFDLLIPPLAEADIMVAYHLLWELVQLELAATVVIDGDSTDFLYPFLDGAAADGKEHLRSSAEAKAAESRSVSERALVANEAALEAVASLLIDGAGESRVLAMGNGGSACDAARTVRLLAAIGVEAQALSTDYAVITALANDVGVERVFSRQVEALGRPGDVLIGFSTSGTSTNLLAAFDEAARRGLHTVGFAGYDGAGFEAHATVEHTFAVASQSVHRIQEAQAVLLDELLERVADREADRESAGRSNP